MLNINQGHEVNFVNRFPSYFETKTFYGPRIFSLLQVFMFGHWTMTKEYNQYIQQKHNHMEQEKI